MKTKRPQRKRPIVAEPTDGPEQGTGDRAKVDRFEAPAAVGGLSKTEVFAFIKDGLQSDDFQTTSDAFKALVDAARNNNALLAHAPDESARDEMADLVSSFLFRAQQVHRVQSADIFQLEEGAPGRLALAEAAALVWKKLRSPRADARLLEAGRSWGAQVFDAVSADPAEAIRVCKKELGSFRDRLQTTRERIGDAKPGSVFDPSYSFNFGGGSITALTVYDDDALIDTNSFPASVLMLDTDHADKASEGLERFLLEADRAIPDLRKKTRAKDCGRPSRSASGQD